VATGSAHQFFAASAGVAGALIGLLFVAISVRPERILGTDADGAHAVRAAATLTAFTNALVVALFGLIPSFNAGKAATAVAIFGLVFILSALTRLVPATHAKQLKPRELWFLSSLVIVFVIQLLAGIHLARHPDDRGSLHTLCVLIVVCFLVGIERAWELVGGDHIRLWSVLARPHSGEAKESGSHAHEDTQD
jgi:hypothetical protein